MREKKKAAHHIVWHTYETEIHERSFLWYLGLAIFTLICLVYAFMSTNFLFALIVIMFDIVVVAHNIFGPRKVKIFFDEHGVGIGHKFYDYTKFNHFAIVYNPPVKKIYLKFKNGFAYPLSIVLEDQDPILLRDHLLKYLQEDLEQSEEFFPESLARLLKI